MSTFDDYKEAIDDYGDTIQATIVFANFFLWDGPANKSREGVVVRQGRRLDVKQDQPEGDEKRPVKTVTPDVAIALPSQHGMIAEVKKSFPKDQELWKDTFEQLESYDHDLFGWPTETQTVTGHDISLIVHTSRAAAIHKFYDARRSTGADFSKPFSIVWFSHSDERNAHYFFRKEVGSISERPVNEALDMGVAVPMHVLVAKYSMIKICDSEPPLPYLMELIWTHVVLPRASTKPQFLKLKKNQKIEIELTVGQIVEELHRGFSFQVLYGGDKERQPMTPKKAWVVRACDHLVSAGMAKWIGTSREAMIVTFKKYDKIQELFINGCIPRADEEKQQELSFVPPKLLPE